MSCIINNGSAYKMKDNPREDLLALEMVENIFKKRRAHIISMPKKGSSVVCCMSGGMDTVANAAILMEEFNFKIYPLFINRGQTNYRWEKESVEFFDSFFSSRYPTLYNKYIEIKLDTPPIAYKNNLRNTKKMTDNPVLRSNVAYPARNPIIALTAMEYAYSLQSKGVFAKTIFAVHTADDPVLHSTLTAVRMANLLMCQITSDFNWQFISLPIEKEFGNYYGKEVMVKWCAENNIPIEKSRSCYIDQQNHCGECFPACQNRKEAFKKAGVHDKTIYNQNEGF